MATAYLTHPVFQEHTMGALHPESPIRLRAIEARLKASSLWPHLSCREPPAASRAQLERVHDAAYLDRLAGLSPASGLVELDPDTWMNPRTLEAAAHAAGAAVFAVDLVLAAEVDNAFCAVRPPGHHAERNTAMGFCFYNNIACAAMHALEAHGLERVAIADFDVHHGNGTEHILAYESRVLMLSSFQHPFYPFTPLNDDAPNIVRSPLPSGAGGREFRAAVEADWLPALTRFRPQLILVSAGFDAHRSDPLADLNFEQEDYAWITDRLTQVADTHCAGRIVSSLEGGYDPSALAACVEAHLQVLSRATSSTGLLR